MATSLLEALQQQAAKQVAPQPLAAPVGAATNQAQSLLATKLTGKVAPATSVVPARQAVGEQQQAAATQAQQAGLTQDLAIKQEQQNQQGADQQQRAAYQQQADAADRASKTQQFHLDTQNILSQFANQTKQLKTASDIADLEQIGFAIRLDNKKYLTDLQATADKAGIDSDSAFKDSYYQTVFSDNEALASDQQAMQNIMQADDLSWKKQMQEISISDAIALAKKNIKEGQAGAMYGAVGGLVSGGAQMYGAVQQSQQASTLQSQKQARAEQAWPNDPQKQQEYLSGIRSIGEK